jgi:hypothetical protein
LPRLRDDFACAIWSGPIPSLASSAVADVIKPSAVDAYCGSSVASRATEKMIPRASANMIA